MKRKNIISLTIAFAFLTMAITGILLYIKQKAHAVEITHTLFGLLFIGFAAFHVINNWGSITSYSKDKKSGKFQKELVVASSIFGVLLIGSVTELFEPLAEAGKFFAGKRPERAQMLNFEEVKTNQETKGQAAEITIQKGEHVDLPATSIWIETADRKFAETIFIPATIQTLPSGVEDVREALREGEATKTPFSATNFKALNAKNAAAKANFEGVTPLENFLIKTKINTPTPFVVVVEIKNGAKTETYETVVDKAAGAYKFQGTASNLMAKGILSFD